MSEYTPERPGVPGSPDVLGWVFAPRKSARVTPASRVSKRTREREISGYLRANPEANREQARRRTADLRRRGYVPEVIRREQATPEQEQRAARHQARSVRSVQAAQAAQAAQAKGPLLVCAYEFGPGTDWVYNLVKADRSTVGRYWNAVRWYLETGISETMTVGRKTRRGLAEFDNLPIANGTLHLVGSLDDIDAMAMGGTLDFENIYPQVSPLGA